MESPCKYYCTHCPVGKHTDPDAHRSKSQKSDQYHAQTKSAQPHDQTRRDHRKFYVSRRTKSVCRNKCQRPYNRLHNRNPDYHMETHLCTGSIWKHIFALAGSMPPRTVTSLVNANTSRQLTMIATSAITLNFFM